MCYSLELKIVVSQKDLRLVEEHKLSHIFNLQMIPSFLALQGGRRFCCLKKDS